MTLSSPVIRYHGTKFRLEPWVLQHFPPHTCYVESFGGTAGVLMQKPRAYAEVHNDLYGAARRDLLSVLLEREGMVALSGYQSDLYAEHLPGWASYSTSARISAGRGTASRTECIWLNPACVDRVSQIGLDLGERA